MRQEGMFGDELGEQESNYYIAIRKPDSKDINTKGFIKNRTQSFLYLTKDRNAAAVFSWKECPVGMSTVRIECPLSLLNLNITKSNW